MYVQTSVEGLGQWGVLRRVKQITLINPDRARPSLGKSGTPDSANDSTESIPRAVRDFRLGCVTFAFPESLLFDVQDTLLLSASSSYSYITIL